MGSITELGILMYDLVTQHREWSDETFGSIAERGPMGPLKHLEKEAKEAQENPDDIMEHADCMLLVLDASARAGHRIMPLLRACMEKLAINKAREWPKTSATEAVEHVR